MYFLYSENWTENSQQLYVYSTYRCTLQFNEEKKIQYYNIFIKIEIIKIMK